MTMQLCFGMSEALDRGRQHGQDGHMKIQINVRINENQDYSPVVPSLPPKGDASVVRTLLSAGAILLSVGGMLFALLFAWVILNFVFV